MANKVNPMGFEAVRHGSGGCVGRLGEYNIDPAYATALFTGDHVILNAGFVEDGAAAAANVLGTFKGCRYTAANGDVVFSPYWPADGNVDASQPVTALVNDDPNQHMQVEIATITQANIGDACVSVAGVGSTQYGRSRQTVVLGAGPMVVVGLVDNDENDFGANADVIVAFTSPGSLQS